MLDLPSLLALAALSAALARLLDETVRRLVDPSGRRPEVCVSCLAFWIGLAIGLASIVALRPDAPFLSGAGVAGLSWVLSRWVDRSVPDAPL